MDILPVSVVIRVRVVMTPQAYLECKPFNVFTEDDWEASHFAVVGGKGNSPPTAEALHRDEAILNAMPTVTTNHTHNRPESEVGLTALQTALYLVVLTLAGVIRCQPQSQGPLAIITQTGLTCMINVLPNPAILHGNAGLSIRVYLELT